LLESIEKYELEQRIRMLEGRLVEVNNTNENLRAELEESDHYVYDRGTTQEEMQNLRRLQGQQVQEIERLTQENQRQRNELQRARELVPSAGRNRNTHMIGHPSLERMNTTQSGINHLFTRSREVSRHSTAWSSNL